MAHIWSYEKGLVQNGELVFESKSTDENGDYHKDMDSNEFERYVPFVVLETNIENQMQSDSIDIGVWHYCGGAHFLQEAHIHKNNTLVHS